MFPKQTELLCVFFDQGGDGTECFQVQARMAMLDKNFKLAEMYYMEQVGGDILCFTSLISNDKHN